jgi:SAM-dependent methyltransferase
LLRQLLVSGIERAGLTLFAFRLRERSLLLNPRVVWRNRRYRTGVGPDGLPIPPEQLITLVAGTPDIEWFLKSSETFSSSVRAMLARNGVDLTGMNSILDFGCGCGRLIRAFHDLDGVTIYGSDYNPELIDWCRSHLPFGTFSVNNLEPPLDYPDSSMDFVYSFSVFTHMPEDLQHRWINELNRILRPGGLLLITTHGDSYLGTLGEPEREAFRSGDLVVRNASVAGTNLCSAFHPRRYLVERLLSEFEILEHASVSSGKTAGVLQDMTLARKPSRSEVEP